LDREAQTKAHHRLLDASQSAVVAPCHQALADFCATVRDHYRMHGRDLPWRRTTDPYLILVSEIMLQQTQVPRVAGKYELFARLFPDIRALAGAPGADVLRAWQGLGYNRRALNLHRSAGLIVAEHGGCVPSTFSELRRLPGVGSATAAAICAFAFGVPVPFLETNIRSAYIHHFFQECSRVSDMDLLPLVEATLDRENPREWYFALMDYGSWLKRTYTNPSRRSRHETAQSPFTGSHRQLRAQILRAFLIYAAEAAHEASGHTVGLDAPAVAALVPAWDREEVRATLEELTREGFLRRSGALHSLG
jgi:A/G-specific adenine glycosylase